MRRSGGVDDPLALGECLGDRVAERAGGGERILLAQSPVNGHPDRAGEVAVTRARRKVGVGGSSGAGLHAAGDAVEQWGQELEARVG